jgi:hypothetical protein
MRWALKKAMMEGNTMDEFDRFMTDLENIGVLSGWSKFMGRDSEKRQTENDANDRGEVTQ